MIIEKFLDEARDSLGEFCMNDCNAFCCRKGTLPVNEEEAKMFQEKNLSKVGENISLKLPCEKLEGTKCGIYKNRPKICKEFPIHQSKKIILISNRCPGVMQGKLYVYAKKLKEEGCEVYFQ